MLMLHRMVEDQGAPCGTGEAKVAGGRSAAGAASQVMTARRAEYPAIGGIPGRSRSARGLNR
jgi:hypothetical protein